MALSILVPVHVEAKILTQRTSVARLSGVPFNHEAELEAGVHLHWALPDALTRARFVDTDDGHRTLFPGVPDLWLVTRFNPPPADSSKRTWRAWVVDSRRETVTPLPSWAPATETDGEAIHTFAGVLPSGGAMGQPGWGIWDSAEHESFDPAVAAYYPTARHRFGFHDDLADLRRALGYVSYSVVGWYGWPAHDPLFGAADRRAQLDAWKFAWKSKGFSRMPTVVAEAASTSAHAYVPGSASMGSAPASRVAQAGMARVGARAGEARRHQQRLTAMKRSTGDLSRVLAAEDPTAATNVGQVLGASVPSEIVCHGAVVEVPLKPPATADAVFRHGDIRVFPSVKTAMAAVASLDEGGNESEMVEALLQSLDGQMAKTQAGVLDLPAALHALSFQSAPGRSRYFGQLDVFAPFPTMQKVPPLKVSPIVGTAPQAGLRRASGHWPALTTRSAAAASSEVKPERIKDSLLRTPQTEKPYEPSESEIDAWIADVGGALAAAAAAAETRGTPIDPAIVRVRDNRRNAQPVVLGPTTDGRGSDGAAYWMDITDRDAMRRLLAAVYGARIGLPDVDRLHEIPGPRWYRPWSPHIVIANQGRAFRFGEDGRFEATGGVRCRRSGETLTSITTGTGKVVLAHQIVSSTVSIATRPGIPPEARPLVDETALLDPANAPAMASISQPGATSAGFAAARRTFESVSRGLVLMRDPSFTDAHRAQVHAMVQGQEPSPIAFLPWRDPWDPIFVDVNYAHPFSSVETDWTLEGPSGKPPGVEFRPKSSAATEPPHGQVEVIDERVFLTSTIVRTLESALVTALTLDKYGNPVKAGAAPADLDEQTFKKMAVLSAPLTGFDRTLLERGLRERSGALRLNRLDIVDAFGIRRSWASGIEDPAYPGGGDGPSPWWTPLTPRLPYWSRLQFRLRSAEDPDRDATFADSPLCGLLVPDLFEHALEVYDATGRALGQIRSDPPQWGSKQATDATTLTTRFEVHPWTAAELGMAPGAHPLDAISNKRLRAFVAGVVGQGSIDVPAGQPDTQFFETAFTSLMRVIDTLRSSVDPKQKVKEPKVRLTGDPIAVLAAGAWLECTGETAPEALSGEPQSLAQPPLVPTISLRVGDPNRPDDGVLGCFLPGAQPSASRFAPVSAEAAQKAVLNELPAGGIREVPAVAPFVAGQECVFPLTLGQVLDLTVLVEAGAGLYAVCGILPRKKITVPREFLAGAERLEPTFRVGPLLSIPSRGGLHPILPTPQVEGHEVHWLRHEPGDAEEDGSWQASPVPSLPQVGAVPPARAQLSEGWMRVTPSKSPPG
jgi:hypothetical protein